MTLLSLQFKFFTQSFNLHVSRIDLMEKEPSSMFRPGKGTGKPSSDNSFVVFIPGTNADKFTGSNGEEILRLTSAAHEGSPVHLYRLL